MRWKSYIRSVYRTFVRNKIMPATKGNKKKHRKNKAGKLGEVSTFSKYLHRIVSHRKYRKCTEYRILRRFFHVSKSWMSFRRCFARTYVHLSPESTLQARWNSMYVIGKAMSWSQWLEEYANFKYLPSSYLNSFATNSPLNRNDQLFLVFPAPIAQ